MKRLILLTISAFVLFSASSFAQLEIGASYELRDEDPESGFGLRVQKGIFDKIPVVNLGLRLHASYFSTENNIDPDNESFSYSQDLTNYDIGIAAIGGISAGLVEPYVGVGLGTENYDLVIQNYNGPQDLQPQDDDENNLYWNMLAGAKVTVVPFLKPFVEYRYSNKNLSEPTLAKAQNGRIMFGVVLSF